MLKLLHLLDIDKKHEAAVLWPGMREHLHTERWHHLAKHSTRETPLPPAITHAHTPMSARTSTPLDKLATLAHVLLCRTGQAPSTSQVVTSLPWASSGCCAKPMCQLRLLLLLLRCIWCAAPVCYCLGIWRTYATRAEAVEDSYFQVGGSLRDFCGRQYKKVVHRGQYRQVSDCDKAATGRHINVYSDRQLKVMHRCTRGGLPTHTHQHYRGNS